MYLFKYFGVKISGKVKKNAKECIDLALSVFHRANAVFNGNRSKKCRCFEKSKFVQNQFLKA